MNPNKLRRNLVVALAAVLCLTLPAQAQKRRSTGTRSPGAQFTIEKITGQVLDAATGQPIPSVAVSAGNRSDSTDANGNFELKNVRGFGYLVFEVERTGYRPHLSQLQPNTPTTLTVHLTPTATVSIRKTNGEVIQVDTESFKFGYPVPFSGYREAESDDFCSISDGKKSYIHRAQIAKLTGPATLVPGGSCCEAGNARKMTMTLKTGQTMDVIFTDTCEERYKVDIGARVHTTGEFLHIPITEIAEIVFP
ncbi:MAG TPA: carboxypeptidase-like regulatory domain-containing protein [Thermoanaerobaculia bacterium]